MEVIVKDIQNMEYLKIYGLNALAYIVTNFGVFSQIEVIDTILKVCVAVPTIIYTIVKTISVIKNEIRNKKND